MKFAHYLLIIPFLLCSACITSAPDSQSPTPPPIPPAQTSERLGSHQVTIRPGSHTISKTKVVFSYTLTVGETKVVIHDKKLSVNGVAYGPLDKGDSITIDPDSVTVAGEVREPLL